MTSRHRAGLSPALRRPSVLRQSLIGGVLVAVLVGACGGATTSPPGGSAQPSGAASAEPSSPASQPAASDGTGTVDFSNAAAALNELDSYAFEVEIRARNTVTGPASIREGTTAMSGIVVNRPDEASTLHLVTSDRDGKVTDETEIVRIGEAAYLRIGGAKGSWQRIPAAEVGTFAALMDAFRPEQMFALYFVPIATDTTTIGQEFRNGIASTHYRGGEDVGEILGTISGVQGFWSSDIWLAEAGGHLVASQAGVQNSDASGGGSFQIVVNITDVNLAGPIAAPI